MRYIIYVLVSLLPLTTIAAPNSDQEIARLESKVATLKTELERVNSEYIKAKNELEKAKGLQKTSRKIGDQLSDTPCACVFNNKKMWNPEKILWKDKFFECGHYLEDGRCEYVREMKPVKIE